MSNRKWVLAAAVVFAGAAAAGAAQAHDEVQWSVTVGSPVGVPVYQQAVPVYQPVPVYTQPAPVYYPRHYHHGYQQPTRWDRDGDGIPNRYDRVYNPVWDRDGDGIPNRYDRRDDRWNRY
ncbi:MAG TPA: hypothetical protein VF169_19455 [Albitalea sp.]|uniref:hypothetical protein n=1 Tax=Piscinibacter sp. TaxID=1903157 RepID=UPI002ED17008